MVAQPYPVANTLTARMHKSINSTVDEGQTPALAHSLRGEGFDASEDGTGWGTPLVPVAYRVHGEHSTAMIGSGIARVADPVEIARCLDSSGGYATNQGGNVVAQPVAFHPTQDPISSADVCHSIGANDNATAAVAIRTAQTGSNGWGINTEGTAYTLDSAQQAVAIAPSLTASNDPSRSPQSSEVTQQVGAVYQAAMQVRRLTPVECERLQGFPDGYTAIPWRGKPASECPDGPRYKALGNSWAVPVVRWIGHRIAHEVALSAR